MFRRLRAFVLYELGRLFHAPQRWVVDLIHSLEVVLILVLIFSYLTSSLYYWHNFWLFAPIFHWLFSSALEVAERYNLLEGRPQLLNILEHFYNVDTSAAIFCLIMIPIALRHGEDPIEEWNVEFFEATEWLFFIIFEMEILVALDEVTPTSLVYFIVTFSAYLKDDARSTIGLAGLVSLGVLAPIIIYFFLTDSRVSRNGGFGHRGFWFSCPVIAFFVVGYPFILPLILPLFYYFERYVDENDPRVDPALRPVTPWIAAKYDLLSPLEHNPTTVWTKKRNNGGRHWIFEKYYPMSPGNGGSDDGDGDIAKKATPLAHQEPSPANYVRRGTECV